MNPRNYAPARPGLAIPMPDRGNRLLPAAGLPVDVANPYYRRLLDDGDIAEVKSATATEPRASTRRRRKAK